jgi:hypothetical protein
MTPLAKKNAHALDQFITFDPGQHKYTFRGVQMEKSVTELVHNQFPKFDANKVAEGLFKKHFSNKKSKYFEMSKDDILQSWEDNKNEACSEGTKLHESIEDFYNGKAVVNPSKEYTVLFENFSNDYKHLVPYRSEWEICYESKKLAGSIDMVFKNPDGTFSIYDWKRSKKIDKYNDYEFGFGDMDHIPHTNFWHYSLQLNVYKYILEKEYNFPIKCLFLVVLHPNNSNYQLFECPNLQSEVELILGDKV